MAESETRENPQFYALEAYEAAKYRLGLCKLEDRSFLPCRLTR